MAELRRFAAETSRQRVRDYLTVEVRKIETELIHLQEVVAKSNDERTAAAATTTPSPPTDRRYQVELTQFAFDESDRFVKLFVTVPDVHKCSEEAVTVAFAENSFCLLVTNLNNRDYKMQTTALVGKIDPAKSYRKIKTNMVAIYAKKAEGNFIFICKNLNINKKKCVRFIILEVKWSALTQSEKLLKEMSIASISSDLKDTDDVDDKDPSAGLMKVMKKMYDSGDSEMKRMLTKAWVEGQEKQRSPDDAMPGMNGMPGIGAKGGFPGFGKMPGMDL